MHSGSASTRKQTRARFLLLTERNQGREHPNQEVAVTALCGVSIVRSVRRLGTSKVNCHWRSTTKAGLGLGLS